MNVREYITNCGKKTPVPMSRLVELKQYYISMYRYYMLNLYDKGYIDDPTVFNKKQILRNMLDLKVSGIANSEGKVPLSYVWVNYLSKLEANEGALEFLDLLRNALKYKEYSNEVDIVYEEFYSARSVKLPFTMNCSKVFISGLNASMGAMSTLIESGKTLKCVNINKELWNLGLEMLEIPEEDWEADSLFCKGMSHSDEVECLELIFEGKIVPTGRYASVLSKWLLKHRWAKNEENVIASRGLLGYLHSKKHYIIYQLYEDKVRQLESEGEKILGILNTKIYVIRDIVNYKIICSPFAVICNDGEDIMVSDSNTFTGYCGEAYSLDRLKEEGNSFVGLPIKIIDDDCDELTLYDREQTDVKEDTWFKANDVDFVYEELRIRNPYKKYINPLYHELFEIYRKSQNGGIYSINLGEYSIKEIQQAKKKIIPAILRQEGV